MKGGVLQWRNIEIEGSEISELKENEEDEIVDVRRPVGESRGEEFWSVLSVYHYSVRRRGLQGDARRWAGTLPSP